MVFLLSSSLPQRKVAISSTVPIFVNDINNEFFCQRPTASSGVAVESLADDHKIFGSNHF